jgi:Pyridoxamine 5'-phosphate oxidase
MGKPSAEIDESVREFLSRQHIFFVATAPSGADGHVNLSPKGLDGFRVLGPREIAYVDYTGSGVETIAHLRDNGRIVIMFCAFDGPPKILRIYGRGHVVEPQDPEFAELLAHFTPLGPARSIIRVDVDRVADSCGYGVPFYDYRGERDQLGAWMEKKGTDGLDQYQREKNAESIDGLPGLRSTSLRARS